MTANGNAVAVSGDVRIRTGATRVYAYITTNKTWQSSSDSYSVAIPVAIGVRYKISMLSTTSSVVGTIFRYGFCDYDNTTTTRTLSQVTRTSPQSTSTVTLAADKKYLIIQISASYGAQVFTTPYIKVEALAL